MTDKLLEEVEARWRTYRESEKRLADKVGETYTPGTIVRARISGGDRPVVIEAVVMETSNQPWWREPTAVMVRNTKTGATRIIDVRPDGFHQVVIVSRPEDTDNPNDHEDP